MALPGRIRSSSRNSVEQNRRATRRPVDCSLLNFAPRTASLRSANHICSAASFATGGRWGTPDVRRGLKQARGGLADTQYDEEIASVALPALAGMLLEPTVGVINSALVGKLGTVQLGAVSVGSLAISFSTFLFSFLLFLTTPEIASALSRQDHDRVSKTTAKALYVACGFGILTTIVVSLGADAIVSYLQPPEPAVAEGAVQFIRVRALGMVPALIGYVAIGVLRGCKDTRTPLFAAIFSAVSSLTLNVLFLYVLDWGTFGCALATTLASIASCCILYGNIISKGVLRLSDLTTPPTWASVTPMLRAGMPLSLRNAISFGMVLYASLLCVRAGSVYQAAFEVIRQVWILTIQSFECLNVGAQVLCSAYLGAGNVVRARGILIRLVSLGTVVGGVVGIAVFVCRDMLAAFFTADAAVILQVGLTLPMVAAFLPLDAVASIMDGSLMAAKQTNFLSMTQILGAAVQYVALLFLASNNLISTLNVWSCLKLLTIFRVLGGLSRNFTSSLSAYPSDPVAGQSSLPDYARVTQPDYARISGPDYARGSGSSATLDRDDEPAPVQQGPACDVVEAGPAGSRTNWALDSMDADTADIGYEFPDGFLSEVGSSSVTESTCSESSTEEDASSTASTLQYRYSWQSAATAPDDAHALEMQEAGLEIDDGVPVTMASASSETASQVAARSRL